MYADVPTTRRGAVAVVARPPGITGQPLATQGQGIGRYLVEHMIGQARGAGLAAVRVVAHPPAEDFYRRLGGVRGGTVAPAPPKITWERPALQFAHR
ncbi:GNAT family N-acetyltransferase [Streptomyces sp. NPDC048751]|uniref:GNAT family N-acetyltransferase n=1 Tax=Streptomyces sp. NPDC048751 TaxID=3365591 RepID=UPI0037172784